MTAIPPRPISEPVFIPGPAGNLEALLDSPPDADGTRVAVICHPHPQYGGTMTNKVVHMLAKSFNEFGAVTVRFNYRGVGASAGTYDEGNGETEDAIAVLDWASRRWPGSRLWLGGFSFGGAIAVRAAAQRNVSRLVSVAPAVKMVVVDGAQLPLCPWLLVQGEADELVDAAEVQHWVRTLSTPPQVALLPGVDHFFHGRLNELRAAVVNWMQQTESEGRSNHA